MGVKETGSGSRVGCDNCDAELTPSDIVVVWQRQEGGPMGPTFRQARGCEDCADAALREEFARRVGSLSSALLPW